jgi:hypothetical protein
LADDDNIYICNKSNKVLIDGNDLIIKDEKYEGTHGLWRVLKKPNKDKLDKEAYDTWWTNKDNFTEKDLSLYKEILMKTHSNCQNNDTTKNTPKSSSGKKWKELVSKIWKEIKTPKSGSGLMKYHENPIEYKYIDNPNQLQERLYYLCAQEKAGNDNFHNEKMGVIKCTIEQFEKMLTILKVQNIS